MKLKYKFVVRKVGEEHIAVAVGKDNESFNGMIKLNESGAFIFKQLMENNLSTNNLVNALTDNYQISEETATNTVNCFLKYLKESDLLEE